MIFTTDGKEYLTPEHLLHEIETELYANNGRIYLYELSSILLIDISLIEQKANELVKKSNRRINLVLGQLITNEYKDQLAVEINDKLQAKGTITIAEIVKFCDLPPDFIQSVLNSRLKRIIKGVQDPNNSQTYCTETYLDQFRSKITGALNAITKPTTVNQILNTFKFPIKVFTTVAQELIKDKKVRGHFTSYQPNGAFIPETYSKIQSDYIENFIKQNHYIEHDALTRIGITDAKSYFKKCDNLINLKTCLIENSIFKQFESGLEETIREEFLIDLYTLTPSILNDDDFSILVDLFSNSNKKYQDKFILINNYIVTKAYLDKLKNEFNQLIKDKAKKDLMDGVLANYFVEKQATRKDAGEQVMSKKEERRKQNASKSKSGAGTQGREVKTKSTKKKYNKKDDFSDDDGDFSNSGDQINKSSVNEVNLKFMNKKDIQKQLNLKENNELTDDLNEQLAKFLEPILDDLYITVAREEFIRSQTISGAQVKKTHSELQNTTQQLFGNICMFNKGLEFVAGKFLIIFFFC